MNDHLEGDWRWYLTIAAVKQWMEIAGLPGEPDEANSNFFEAQSTLGDLSMTATLSVDASERQKQGASIYRGKVTLHGRRRRVECTVMPPIRAEGPLPQLVRVTLK